MKTNLYRIYDETCQRSSTVFEASNNDFAVKAFRLMYPMDSSSEYSLYRICEFDDIGLSVTSISPECLIKGADVVEERFLELKEADNVSTD